MPHVFKKNFFIFLFFIYHTKFFILNNTLSPTLLYILLLPFCFYLYIYLFLFVISQYHFCLFIYFLYFFHKLLCFHIFLLLSYLKVYSSLFTIIDFNSDNFVAMCTLLLKANSVVANHSD